MVGPLQEVQVEFKLTKQGVRGLDVIPGRSRGKRLPDPPRQPAPRYECWHIRVVALDANHDERSVCGEVFSH